MQTDRLQVKGINNTAYADQYLGATADVKITAAMAALPSTGGVVDATGLLGTQSIASTITFPAYPVLLKLGATTFTGPASGPVFQINSYQANGSAITGIGMVADNSPNPQTITSIKANNNGDVIKCGLANQTGVVSGIRLEHLEIDGNNLASNGLTLDSVSQSLFDDLTFKNLSGAAINAIASGTVANLGVQFNRFSHIRSTNVNQVLFAASNTAKTSDFTQNVLLDWDCNYNGTSPGMQFNGADSNWAFGIKIFKASGTAYDVQFDSPGGSNYGGLSNEFYGLHTSATNTINVQANANRNIVKGFSVAENQTAPVVAAGTYFAYEQTGSLPSANAPIASIGSTPVAAFVNSFNNQASIGATTLYSIPSGIAQNFLLVYYIEVAQQATTSSSVTLTVTWSDGISQSFTSPATTNNTGNVVSGTVVVRGNVSSNIQYSTTYASSGATPMQYHVTLRMIGL